ncbi:MFS transporter [Arthrobacter sp. AQ5-06]|nr:MFS transporter [Arthrobacter sp. AQ5-06]
MTPALVSMAFKIQHITSTPQEAANQLGMVMGLGALFALICNPLVGRFSDRTTSRLGMRRPWILGGVLVALGALAIIGVTTNVWIVLLCWCLVQASMNGALAAITASLPDQVLVHRRGKVSGILGMTTPLAILAGTFVVNFLGNDLIRFVVPGIIAVVLTLAFFFTVKDRVLTIKPTNSYSVKEFFGSFVFNPVKHKDFAWTWLTKFLIMFGYIGIATFMPLYLTEKFGLSEQDVISTIVLAHVASTLMVVVSGPIGGVWSDRVGKRRIFVAASGVIMVVGLLILAFAPSVALVIVAQGVIGFGFGAFASVDYALSTQVLPNEADTAKDLGVLNMANALPASIAPAIAPAIIAIGAGTAIGGYTLWYLFGAVVSLAGAVLVYRIKGVK